MSEQYNSDQALTISQESRWKKGVNVAKKIDHYASEFILLEAGVGTLIFGGGSASGLSPAEAAKQTGIVLGIGNGVIVTGNAAAIAAIRGYEKVSKSFHHWKEEGKLRETLLAPVRKSTDIVTFKKGK